MATACADSAGVGRPDFGAHDLGLGSGTAERTYQVLSLQDPELDADFFFSTSKGSPFQGDELDEAAYLDLEARDIALESPLQLNARGLVATFFDESGAVIPIADAGVISGAIILTDGYESLVLFTPEGRLDLAIVYEIGDGDAWALGGANLVQDLGRVDQTGGVCRFATPSRAQEEVGIPVTHLTDCSDVSIGWLPS